MKITKAKIDRKFRDSLIDDMQRLSRSISLYTDENGQQNKELADKFNELYTIVLRLK